MKVKLVRSSIGATKHQRKNLQALGLRKVNQVKEFSDVPSIRGKIRKVSHLIEVIES
jgi:large subunit ribosomal protein L30